MKPKPDQIAVQCCPKHWEMMEKALEERGMKALISPTPEEANKRFKHAQSRDSFTELNDPLLEAFMLQASQVINCGIPETLLNNAKDNQICPVCIAMTLTQDATPESTELHWTSGLADHMLTTYRTRGAVPRLQ